MKATSGTHTTDLARRLWPASLVRGLVALALGAYVLSRPSAPPATLARTVCLVWIVEGLLALWASRFAATLFRNRVLLMIRGVVGILAALVLLALPLGDVFGPWRPGQTLLFIITVMSAVTVIVVQVIMAATMDLVIGLDVHRRIASDWSIIVGALVSIVFGALVAVAFFAASSVPGRVLGVVGVAGGLVLVAGALRLRAAR